MLRLVILIGITIIIGCSSKKDPSRRHRTPLDTAYLKNVLGKGQIEDPPQPIQQIQECDTLKVTDYKINLQLIKLDDNSLLTSSIEKIAKGFISTECKRDKLFCKEIFLYDQRFYQSNTGEILFQFGYRFNNGSAGFEKNSSSFFVFGVIHENTIGHYDIASDLMFEIQLTLSGIEISSSETKIWGEMYPYYDGGDFGKFRLLFEGDKKTYEYQCKDHGH